MPKPKYINLLTDFAFKRIFGNEQHKDLLIHFLNEVLAPQGKKLVNLQFKNNEQTIDNEEDRKVIFDFFCEDETGSHFIVEIQRNKPKFFKERMLYYASKVIVEQGQKGNWEYEINPVFVVGIMDFRYTEDSILEYYSLIGENNRKLYTDRLTFITIELGNFNKSILELETNMDKWLFMLKNLYKLEVVPETLKEHVYMKILSLAEYAALSKPEQMAYDRSLKIERDYNSVMNYQKELAWEEGLNAGKEKGREEGKREEKKTIIKLLNQNGLSIKEINRYTGYPEEEIMNLLG